MYLQFSLNLVFLFHFFIFAHFSSRKAPVPIRWRYTINITLIFTFDHITDLPWTHDSYETFDAGINSSLILMKDLKDSWYNILPIRMYELSMCTLAQALCQAMLDKVFADSKPISEESAYTLAVRFDDTVANITSLFTEEFELEEKVNVWSKFTKMSQLLKAQLLQITDLWRTDHLLTQSYVCEEIRQIVKMRFPDDKYRLKILKEIQ